MPPPSTLWRWCLTLVRAALRREHERLLIELAAACDTLAGAEPDAPYRHWAAVYRGAAARLSADVMYPGGHDADA